jgi:hypothetical protein
MPIPDNKANTNGAAPHFPTELGKHSAFPKKTLQWRKIQELKKKQIDDPKTTLHTYKYIAN